MSPASTSTSPMAWFNGRLLPLEKVRVSAMDRGFLYGDGLFETMRVQDGTVLFLDDHLRRLHRSLACLRIPLDRPPEWKGVLTELVARSGIERGAASAKIIVTRGIHPAMGLPEAVRPTVLIQVQPYTPPSSEAYCLGWRLHTFRRGFSPPMAAHKSLNYLYFMEARQAAQEAGAQEALILDPHGRPVETAAGNLLARTGNKWWTPSGAHRLPGITLGRTMRIMASQGQPVEERPASMGDLLGARTVWVLNSLMLVMPARSIDGQRQLCTAEEDACRVREALVRLGRSQGSCFDT